MKSVTPEKMDYPVIDAIVSPSTHLNTLSKIEVNGLLDTNQGDLHEIFRKCALAVLNSGSYIDDGKELPHNLTEVYTQQHSI